jgi:hypothetical protein
MTSIKTLFVAGLVYCGLGLGLPRISYGITGCTNAYLTGTYNAQIASINFQSLGSSGGTTGSAATGTAVANGGFGNNSNSFSGKTPGLGRFYLDGNGNILGFDNSINTSTIIGSYSVNSDCTASLTLRSGQSFNAVVAQAGAQVQFIETDSAGNGAVGSLLRSANACLSNADYPATLAFTFFGAQSVAGTAGATGATGTTDTSATVMPYSAVGSLTLENNQGFALKEWVFSAGKLQTINTSGTYSVGFDCSLKLTINNSASANGGTTGAALSPVAFQGLLVNKNGGVIALQPDAGTTITGSFVAQ